MTSIRAFGLAASLLLFAAHAAAAESNRVSTDHDSASLVSETNGFVPGQPLRLGLRLKLAPGWHSYWSNPGDAGEAPSLSVHATGAAVGTAGPINWPAPLRLPDGPLMSYGYTGDFVLPVTFRPDPSRPGAGRSLHLSADAEWLACANVCVPEHGSFQLDLPSVQATQPSVQAPLFATAHARQPLPSPFPATLGADNTLLLAGKGLGPETVRAAWFFPASSGLIDQVAAQPIEVGPGRVAISLKPEQALASAKSLKGLVVLRDPAGNVSYLAIDAGRTRVPLAPGASGRTALPRLLLLALLGGVVLNLMPCVFPVLAMKALALSRLSGAARAEMRRSAAFYTAGILVAFAGLGMLMLGLRAAGSAVGWGFQFQQPAFVAGTCWLLFAVGLNLAGLFAVGSGMAGIGQGVASRRGHGGDFATGLLAVLVASPCTAPFMGVAVAGALSAPAAVGIAVFLFMGLGLALPYIALALLPGLVARLPRPGPWMTVLQQALSFPVFASCAWLAWVISIEGGDRAVLVLASGMVLLALAGWLLGLSQRRELGRSPACLAGSVLCLGVALALLPGLSMARPQARAAAGADTEAFSVPRLAALRTQGRPVFVDMTAAWCITCLVNERLALSPDKVREAFAAHHVAYLKGDWTNRDPGIGDFLRAHGRDGVPFYVYYPPGAEGRVLPQILTASRVLDEIKG